MFIHPERIFASLSLSAWSLAYVPNEKDDTVSGLDKQTHIKLKDIAVSRLPCGVLIH